MPAGQELGPRAVEDDPAVLQNVAAVAELERAQDALLDEPSLGLAPVTVASIFENLARINRDGVTILLV